MVLTGARAPSRALDAGFVLAVGLSARFALVAWACTRFPPVEDGGYYDVLSRRLAQGDGYTWLWPDGAVTYVAHYPVGYPALVALVRILFGVEGGAAMIVNALLGGLSALAAFWLVSELGVPRWRPLAAGLAVALHPALLPYTAATMTEGVTASLLVIAVALASGAVRAQTRWPWVALAGIVMGIATLVRPQSLLLAPVLGLLAVRRSGHGGSRLLGAIALTSVALACVAPWTIRNCLHMHQCAMVSVNGGWNLLIGAQTSTGAWEPMVVPDRCASVWDEAAKDSCFAGAARDLVAEAPLRWLERVPSKLAATFDYFGAAPWYLHASNPVAMDEAAKRRLGAFEAIVCRLFLVGALVACGRFEGARGTARKFVALAGVVAALSVHGWIGYLALVVCVGMLGKSGWISAPVVVPSAAAIVALLAVVHAVFFGAGRYGLVAAPFVAMLAFVPRDRAKTMATKTVHSGDVLRPMVPSRACPP